MLRIACCAFTASLLGLASSAALAQETSADIVAVQVRSQGFACDKAVSATRDAKRSKPDYTVYVLKCSNATYRVGRAPDLAAKIEVIKQPKSK